MSGCYSEFLPIFRVLHCDWLALFDTTREVCLSFFRLTNKLVLQRWHIATVLTQSPFVWTGHNVYRILALGFHLRIRELRSQNEHKRQHGTAWCTDIFHPERSSVPRARDESERGALFSSGSLLLFSRAIRTNERLDGWWFLQFATECLFQDNITWDVCM